MVGLSLRYFKGIEVRHIKPMIYCKYSYLMKSKNMIYLQTVKSVKGIVVFMLICCLAMPRTGIHLIIHIPALVHHFQKHSEDQAHTHFLDFIKEHLLETETHHHEDSKDHDNLPFSHNHSSENYQTVSFNLVFYKASFKLRQQPYQSIRIITNQIFTSSDFYQSIWKPPRLS